MIMTPNIVRLMYGTLVVATVSISGALWCDRTGPKLVKTVDYVQLYQGTLERCMATEYCTTSSNYPVAAVWTNYNAHWVADTNTWTRYEGTNAIVTNYWRLSGYTNAVVVTNDFVNRLYKCKLPHDVNWPDLEGDPLRGLVGSTDSQKYLWNAHSNLVVSGYPACNGTYAYVTNNTASVLKLNGYPVDPIWTGSDDMDPDTYLYRSGDNWIIDYGPLDNEYEERAGLKAFYYTDLKSCLIGSVADLLLIGDPYWDSPPAGVWFTHRGDSALNGPWYKYLINETTTYPSNQVISGMSVVGDSFASNLVRDAICHSYVNKRWQDLLVGSGRITKYDPRYDHHATGVIDAHVSRRMLHNLLSDTSIDFESTWMPYYNERFGFRNVNVPRDPMYVMTTITPGAVSNYVGFQAFEITFNSISNILGSPINLFSIRNPPATSSLTMIGRYLHELQWTRTGDAYLWQNPGRKTGNGTLVTNHWVREGYGATWGEATSIAATNFTFQTEAGSDGAIVPFGWTRGTYSVGGKYYLAQAECGQADLLYLGACTNIEADIGFWLRGKIIHEAPAYVNFAYDDFGSGWSLGTNTYQEVFTINNSRTNRFPSINVGGSSISWCTEPGTNGYDSTTVSSWTVDTPEIIFKWHFNYLTNTVQ